MEVRTLDSTVNRGSLYVKLYLMPLIDCPSIAYLYTGKTNKMKIYFAPIFLSIFWVSLITAQVDTDRMLEQAQLYTDSYIKKDFDALVTMSHPNLLSFGSTKELLSKDLKADQQVLEGFGFEFKSATLGEPGELYESNGEALSFIPQKFLVEIAGEEFLYTKHILASSNTQGKNWFFVSLDRFDAGSLGDFIPSYSQDMPWPEQVSMVPTSAIIENPLPEGAIEIKEKGN